MLTVKFTIPRYHNSYIHFTGDADQFLNRPIVINQEAVGVITRVISSTEDSIEVEGHLWTAGVNYFDKPDGLEPADITIK